MRVTGPLAKALLGVVACGTACAARPVFDVSG